MGRRSSRERDRGSGRERDGGKGRRIGEGSGGEKGYETSRDTGREFFFFLTGKLSIGISNKYLQMKFKIH